MSDNQQPEEHVLFYRSEKLEPRELGYEQIKFVFMKLSEWLLSRRQETLEQLMEMLERLQQLYPRAYEWMMQIIAQQLPQFLGTQPPPMAQTVPIPT